jgi:hypothetical protein
MASAAGAAPRPIPGLEASPQAVIDLLGVVGYGILIAFDRMAGDARLSPDLRRRAALSEMAAAEVAHYRRVSERLVQLGADPEEAMRPFVAPLDAFHDWLEGLVKAYIGDGIADDFYREVANFLGEPDRSLVLDVLHDTRHAEFAVTEVRAAIEADPRRAGRLALWARRLVGEAISQAQQVAAERDALTELITVGYGIGALIKRLTNAHTERLKALGLSS